MIAYASAEDNLSYWDKTRKHLKKTARRLKQNTVAFQSKRRDVFQKRLGEIKNSVEEKNLLINLLEL